MIDSITGNIIGYGTLSEYRKVELSTVITVDDISISFKDNYAFFNISAADYNQATTKALFIMNRFCLYLSTLTRQYHFCNIYQAVSDGVRIPIPKYVHLMKVRAYNLDQMVERIHIAEEYINKVDVGLEKAIAYFNHSLFMKEERFLVVDPLSYHSKLINSEMILNYHKSVTTILGEKITDKDYDIRYKKYGVSEEVWDEVQILRRLRNKYDVAHYSVDWDSLEALTSQLDLAERVAYQIIICYCDWLKVSEM